MRTDRDFEAVPDRRKILRARDLRRARNRDRGVVRRAWRRYVESLPALPEEAPMPDGAG